MRNSSGAAPGWAANLPSFTIPTPAATAWSRVGCLGQLEYFIKRCHDGPWPAVLRVVFNQTVAGVKRGFPVGGSIILFHAPATVACLQPWLGVQWGTPQSFTPGAARAPRHFNGGAAWVMPKRLPRLGEAGRRMGGGRGTGKRKSKTLRHWGFPCDPSTQY